MSKKSTKALASATLMSLVLTTALSAGPVQAAAGKVTRTSGTDRYATAASVATENWKDGCQDVVLVSGEGYADAVSASALAKKLNAPILLTSAETLSSDTQSALNKLKPKNVYVIGGEKSIATSIRTELKKNSYNLIELGGADRYETNAKVAQKLVDLGVKADEVIMVGGEGFSDALSVAPVAAAKGQILLLGVNDANYMKSVIDFVSKNNSKTTVVGTENVINSSIYNKVNATNRVNGGSDRFDTNLKVLASFKETLKMDQLYVASAQENSRDDGYADALVASALAGKTASPLVLMDKDGSTSTTNAIKYVSDNATDKSTVTIIGGTGVVSQNIQDQLSKGTPNPVKDATVKSVEVLGLNQIKVTFGEEIDSDSAEDVTNYKLDGAQLTKVDKDDKAVDENSAVAVSDGDHVIITLANPRKQEGKATFSVKSGILTASKQSVKAKDVDLTFKDLTTPTVTNVTAEGNNQLTVEFSQAVNMKEINTLKDKFKIDGKSISNYGINSTYSEIKDKIVVDKDFGAPLATWSNKVMFYLDSRIGAGDHKLTVSTGDGKKGLLSTASDFQVQETEKSFKIDSMSTQPVPTKIEETKSGEVHITFDRSMDVKTAKHDVSNYKINDKALPASAEIKMADDDKVIKLKHVGSVINTGANTVFVSDNVKDAFGNYVPKNTTKSFEDVKDEVKPKVNSARIIDSETVRVSFSKDVKGSIATNTSNYTLKDDKGVDITDHIKEILSTSGDKDDAADFNIKLNKYNPKDSTENWQLTSKKYTLTIKNIKDTASNPNILEEVTMDLTDGVDNVAPEGVGIYSRGKSASGKDEVIVYFDEAMDSGITDKSNYKYMNGEGDYKQLPADANIRTGGDNKSAIIEFPSSYNVKTTGKVITGNSNDVLAVSVANVKDLAGNPLATTAFDNGQKIELPMAGATVKTKTIRTEYENNDDPTSPELNIIVQFSKSVDKVATNDFTFGGVTPSTQSISGDTVTFKFTKNDYATADDLKKAAAANPGSAMIKADGIVYANGEKNTHPTKIELVKAQGNKLAFAVTASAQSTDETGARLCVDKDGKPVDLSTDQSLVYNNYAAPRTTAFDQDTDKAGYWTATKDNNGGKVYVTFDSPLDAGAANTNDFTFLAEDSTELKASKAIIDADCPNTVVFIFNKDIKNYDKFTGTLDVSAKSSAAFKAQRDLNGDCRVMKPTQYDQKSKYITIKDSSTPVTTGFTVDSVKAGTAPGTQIIVVSGVDSTKYDVTIGDVAARLVDGKFVATVNGNYTVDTAKAIVKLTEKTVTPVVTDFTVDSVKAGTAPGTQIIVVSGVDSTKYNVTIGDVAARSVAGKFVATVNGSYTVDTAKAIVKVTAK